MRRVDGHRITDLSDAREVTVPDGLCRNREGSRQRAADALPLIAEKEEASVAHAGDHRARRRIDSAAAAGPAGLADRSSCARRTCRGGGTRTGVPWNAFAPARVATLIKRRCLAAELGRVLGLLDLELLDRLDRRIDDEIVEQLVGHLDAVEQVDVVTGTLPAHVGQWSGLLQRVSARAAGRKNDARRSTGRARGNCGHSAGAAPPRGSRSRR